MIIEEVTVTDTPTTIHSLICQARSDALQSNPRIKSILFRTSGSVQVLIEEKNTVTASVLLDPSATVPQPFASFEDYNLVNCLLSIATGTTTVQITASQEGN